MSMCRWETIENPEGDFDEQLKILREKAGNFNVDYNKKNW